MQLGLQGQHAGPERVELLAYGAKHTACEKWQRVFMCKGTKLDLNCTLYLKLFTCHENFQQCVVVVIEYTLSDNVSRLFFSMDDKGSYTNDE